jgi:hypothetical protein
MYGRGFRWLTLVVPVTVLAGCGGTTHVVTTTVVRPGPVRALIPAPSQYPVAGICPLSNRGVSLVTIYVGDGTPEPRCLRVRANERLQIVNKLGLSGPPDKTITIRWPPFGSRTLAPGSTIVFKQNFASYLSPGDHIIGNLGAEILLVH